jgi:hypothetical protein
MTVPPLNLKSRNEEASMEAAAKPFGIANCKSQMANLKSEIWPLKFLAERGQGPSAAAGRLASEHHFWGNQS